jgi:glycosyltransferase involved in cell wall biosynthesis
MLKILVIAPYQTFLFKGGLRTQVERTVAELKLLGCKIHYWDGVQSLAEIKPDLIHVFSMNAPTFFQGTALKKTGIPLVFSSVMWRSGSRQIMRWVTNTLEHCPFFLLSDTLACKRLGAMADLILPNTKQELNWISEVCSVPVEKCVVVPNGADNHFSTTDLDQVDLTEFPKEFVFSLSVLSRRKNVAKLVRSVNDLNIPLIHVGKEMETGYLSELKKLDTRNNCRFLGELNNTDPLVGALLKKCDVFALVSEYETPGIAAMEAGLQDANCVLTRIGGADEYFGKYARYVDPFDFNDVKSKISTAWEQGRPSSGQLPEVIQSKFSWARVAEQTIAAYQTIL